MDVDRNTGARGRRAGRAVPVREAGTQGGHYPAIMGGTGSQWQYRPLTALDNRRGIGFHA